MLANQEPKASALFWYTQRYHTLGVMLRGPRTAIPYKENLRGPCRDRRRLIRFVRVCSTDRGWCVADRGAWAMFLGNGSRLRGMDGGLSVSVSRGTHSFTLACQSQLSLIPQRGLRLDLRGVTRLQCVRRGLKLTVYQLVGVDTISRQQTRQYCVFWYGRLITVSYSRALNCPIIPVNWCASFHKRFCISN